MKKLLIILCLFSMTAHAQRTLPPCTSEPFNNCYGTYTFPSGDKYVGEWKDDKRNGQGTYTYADGNKYVGQFKDDKRNGQGTFTFANGNKYVGQFKDGEKNGQGTFTWSDGDKFVGQFKDGNRNGFGTHYNANGSIYQQGLWRDDQFVQAQSPPVVAPPVVPKPPANNAQDVKRQRCISLGLVPNSADFKQCMN